MSVIEVTFDPTLWNGADSGTSPGDAGYDCTTIWPDMDGTTFWAFEQAGGCGFARVNYSDGSIVRQDAMFGNPGGSAFGTQAVSQQSVMWQQDDNGFYYTIVADIEDPGEILTLYRFHIDPSMGTPGSLLNGYDVTDNTYIIRTVMGSSPTELQDMTLFTNSGTRYLAFISAGATTAARVMWVMLADTLTLVGTFTTPTSVGVGLNVFADKNGVLWGMFDGDFVSAATGNTFVRWNPADGQSGGVLNTTTQFVSSTVSGIDAAFQVAYIPISNSVFLADTQSESGDSNVAVVSMDSWTQTAIQSDSTFFSADVTDSNEVSLKEGVQDGQLMIQGDPGDESQTGGILRIIDPTMLVASSSLNATTLINGSGVPTPVGTSLDFASFAWNESIGRVAVCYGPESFSPGSPIYIFDFGAPIPPPPVNDNACFSLQKLILSLKTDTIPARGKK